MCKPFILSILLHIGRIGASGGFIWRSVKPLSQQIRVIITSLPLLCSSKCISQAKNSRLYIKLVIFTILINLADISLAQNVNYKKQASPITYRRYIGSGSKDSAAIKNPYDTKDYLSKLASKLPSEQRDLLLRGNNLISSQAKKGKTSISDIKAVEGEAWSLKKDLEKYRAYAVKEGARYPDESLEKMLAQGGLFIEDGINVLTLGYGSERGLRFRENDGLDLSWQARTVVEQGGQVVINIFGELYAIVDLITLDSLIDLPDDVYKDNNPVVRPFVFIGRTIGSGWKTTQNIGNTLTWGYFDNFSGSSAMCFRDVVESLKHGGQAVSYLPRELVYLLVGIDEDTDKMLDWILIVPWELASNVVQMQGISNMQDYRAAFKEKGVVGSLLELTGSTIITYRTIDEILDELKNDHKNKHGDGKATSSSTGSGGNGGGGGSSGGGGIEEPPNEIYYFEIW